jgi:hypothetical protein
VPVETRVCLEHLERSRSVNIGADEPVFAGPVERDAKLLAEAIGDAGDVVLLGSIATPKYVEPLVAALGARLLFPTDFVVRGDMSRGGLLLRAADAPGRSSRTARCSAQSDTARARPKLGPRDPRSG